MHHRRGAWPHRDPRSAFLDRCCVSPPRRSRSTTRLRSSPERTEAGDRRPGMGGARGTAFRYPSARSDNFGRGYAPRQGCVPKVRPEGAFRRPAAKPRLGSRGKGRSGRLSLSLRVSYLGCRLPASGSPTPARGEMATAENDERAEAEGPGHGHHADRALLREGRDHADGCRRRQGRTSTAIPDGRAQPRRGHRHRGHARAGASARSTGRSRPGRRRSAST